MKYLLSIALELFVQLVLYIIVLFYVGDDTTYMQPEYIIPTIGIFRIVTYYIDKFIEKLIHE